MNTKNRTVPLLAIIAVVLAAGCGGLFNPASSDDSEWAAPASVHIEDLMVGGVAWACGHWTDGVPDTDSVTLDLYLGRSGPEQPMDRPTSRQLDGLREAGVTIVETYHAPAVRARLAPEVMRSLAVQTARTAPRPDQYNLRVIIGLSVPPDSGLATFRRHGGAVKNVFEQINAVGGAIPNDSLPELRASGVVNYTDLHMHSCLQS